MVSQIIISLVLVGIIGVSTFLFFYKKRKREKVRELFENNLVGDELIITRIVKDYMDIQIPVIIVRSPNDEIPHYGNRTWDQIEYLHGVSAKAFYNPELKHVCVRKWVLSDPKQEISNHIYFKLLVHEFNHHRGYHHGSDMNKEDIRLINEILPLLEKYDLI
jgi:hypothetical protein